MNSARRQALTRLPTDESTRDTFPAGFPSSIDIPAARYTDPSFFELERKHVFEHSWLFVAHTEQLPAAGDYLMLDALDRMGHPLFLVRGHDGRVHAFYNACRHRGGPLVDQASGSVRKNLVCKYHAWTYDLEGRLLGFPEAKSFPRDAKDACPPLAQVECESWGPLLFVKIAPGGPSLRAYLEPGASELDGLLGDAAQGVHLAAVRSLDVACNWKLPGDGNVSSRRAIASRSTCGRPVAMRAGFPASMRAVEALLRGSTASGSCASRTAASRACAPSPIASELRACYWPYRRGVEPPITLPWWCT